MNDIKGALTRKLGPFPAWVWLTIFGLGVWYYRNKIGGGGQTANTANTTTGQVVSDAAAPQTPVTLAPGESVYDPNTGALVNGQPDPSAMSTQPGTVGPADNSIADAINRMTDSLNQTPTGAPADGGPSGPGKPPGHGGKKPKLRGKGAKYAPFGHNKPKAPKGMKAVGLGHGFWEFLPKPKGNRRTAKPKSEIQSGKWKPAGGDKQKRSNAATKPPNGRARKTGKSNSGSGRPRANMATATTAQRSRPTVPLANRTTPNQRPEATHPVAKAPGRAAPKPAPKPAARPAAPPSRARVVSKPAAKKKR